jgi:hypothetical protein
MFKEVKDDDKKILEKCKIYTLELKYFFNQTTKENYDEDKTYKMVNDYLLMLDKFSYEFKFVYKYYNNKEFFYENELYTENELIYHFWLLINRLELPKIIKLNKLTQYNLYFNKHRETLDYTNVKDEDIYMLKKYQDVIIKIIEDASNNHHMRELIDIDFLYRLQDMYHSKYLNIFNDYFIGQDHPLFRYLDLLMDEDIECRILDV